METGCFIRLLTVLRTGNKIAKFNAVKEKCKVFNILITTDMQIKAIKSHVLPKCLEQRFKRMIIMMVK